jgi:hypothetical protein
MSDCHCAPEEKRVPTALMRVSLLLLLLLLQISPPLRLLIISSDPHLCVENQNDNAVDIARCFPIRDRCGNKSETRGVCTHFARVRLYS